MAVTIWQEQLPIKAFVGGVIMQNIIKVANCKHYELNN